MSDPVKSVDIEDVLSSIRRLVSEDARPRVHSAPSDPDRLVLTPAQRVSGTDHGQELPGAAQDPVLPTVPMEQKSPVDSFEFRSRETVSKKTPAARESIDTSDEAEQHSPSDSLSRLVEDEVGRALRAFSKDAPETEDLAKDGRGLESRSDEDDSTDRNTGDTSDLGVGTVENSGNEHGIEAHEIAEQSATLAKDVRPAPTLEQKVAELEAMIAQTDEDWEPEPAADDTNAAYVQEAPEPLAWQDYSAPDGHIQDDIISEAEEPERRFDELAYFRKRAEREDISKRKADVGSEEKSDTDNLGFEEAATIDEEMLRDMVADIVRQELQGALGERITRNVRKLVRREIQRALLSEHFD